MDTNLTTRGGVCLDLDYSPHEYAVKDMTFYFSSEYLMKRFIDKFDEHRRLWKTKALYLLGVDVIGDYIVAVALYKQIEKRGFKCKYGSELYGYFNFNNYISCFRKLSELDKLYEVR